MTKEQIAEEHWDLAYIMDKDESVKPYVVRDYIAGYDKGFEAAEPKWKLCSEHQPMCYQTGHWDGKKSDNYLLEDRDGKQYIACAYETIYRGETYFEWYDNNDCSIDYPVKFIEIPD